EKILELELEMVQQRILGASGSKKFLFGCTERVKKFLLVEGTDTKYGARHLKRAIEKNLVSPLASLMATSQLRFGDFVRVDLDAAGRLIFSKEVEGAVSRMRNRDENEGGVQPMPALANSSSVGILGYGAF